MSETKTNQTIDLTPPPGKLDSWSCTIGEAELGFRIGADAPMREAVAEAYERITGEKPKFIFSGWGAELTEPQRAVVEDRLPSDEYRQQWMLREAAPDLLAACEALEDRDCEVYGEGRTCPPNEYPTRCPVCLARTAIARAKGGE